MHFQNRQFHCQPYFPLFKKAFNFIYRNSLDIKYA